MLLISYLFKCRSTKLLGLLHGACERKHEALVLKVEKVDEEAEMTQYIEQYGKDNVLVVESGVSPLLPHPNRDRSIKRAASRRDRDFVMNRVVFISVPPWKNSICGKKTEGKGSERSTAASDSSFPVRITKDFPALIIA